MKFNSFFKTVFYGACLGIGLLPPGFSVATLALLMGIYPELIGLLNELFSTNMKKSLKKLGGLALGAVVAIVIASRLISTATAHFPYQVRFLFLGLILATIPVIYKQADVKSNFKIKHYIYLSVAVVATSVFVFGGTLSLVNLDGGITVGKIVFLLIAGMLVSASMILPGLSGALMLILIGAYDFLLESLNAFNITVLGTVAVGGVLGLIICGRLIKHLIENNETVMYAISLGLVIGSVPAILNDGVPRDVINVATALSLMLIGFITVMLINAKKA